MPEWVEKVWGKEEVIVNNGLYCGKILHLNKGARSSLHCHRVKHETFYVLDGRIHLEIEGHGHPELLIPGDRRTILPTQYHRFEGLEDSRIIEFSTTHSDSDVFRKEPSQAP